MIRLRHSLLLAAALCAFAVAAVPASANYLDVIRECYNTGQLPAGKYSRTDLKRARNRLPTDVREYSNCTDLINAALAASRRRSGGGGGAGGAAGGGAPAASFKTPSGAGTGSQNDLNALNQTTDPSSGHSAPPRVAVAGSRLSPSTGGLIDAAQRTDGNSLPLPLILSLAGLAALAAVAGAAVVRRRWPDIRRAPARLLGR